MLAHTAHRLLASRRLVAALLLAQLLVALCIGPVAASSGGGPFPVR